MPVTAKLSRHFYEKLGDEATNELVNWFNSVDLDYRTELRTLNEQNFALFDAKMDVFRAEVREEVKSTVGAAKSQLLLWMFGFWTTTMATQAGLFYLVLRSR
jgi:hypothetical protein